VTKKKHRSEPRVFDGRIIHSDEMERASDADRHQRNTSRYRGISSATQY
jgi:hypothetical protein